MVLFDNNIFFLTFMTIKLLCFNEIISTRETLIKFIEFKLIMMNEKSLQYKASEFTNINWVGNQIFLKKIIYTQSIINA